MNYYFLTDDYDWSITAVVMSEKEYIELQKIIDEIREKNYDCYYEDIVATLQALDNTTVIEKCGFKNLMY